MEVVTHALLPVLIAAPLLPARTPARSRWRPLTLIGLFGALPDLLNPHLSLEDRYASWSHSVPCWLLLTAGIALVAARWPRRLPRRLAMLLSFAYGLHLACDGISGGITWLAPFSAQIIGDDYVSPRWWIPLDFILVLAAYLQLRAWPNLRAWRHPRPGVRGREHPDFNSDRP